MEDSHAQSCELRVAVPRPANPEHATGVLLEFARTRSKIISVAARGAKVHASEHGFRYALLWPHFLSDEALVDVRYLGAPPMLVAERPHAAAKTLVGLVKSSRGFLGDSASIDEVFAERANYIKLVEDAELRRMMQSFYRMDYESHAVIAARTDAALAKAIDRLHYILPYRAELRAYARTYAQAPQFDEGPEEIEAARRADVLLRGVLAEEFGDGTKIDPDALFAAFFAFVGGDLDLRPYGAPASFVTQGSPDSSLFFCFAEFACFCIEHDIEATFWKSALPIFVACSEVFVELYWHGGPRTQHSYSCTYRRGRKFARARRQFVRDAFRGRDTARLEADYGMILAAALRDTVQQMVPPQPKSAPKPDARRYAASPATAPGRDGEATPTNDSPYEDGELRTMTDTHVELLLLRETTNSSGSTIYEKLCIYPSDGSPCDDAGLTLWSNVTSASDSVTVPVGESNEEENTALNNAMSTIADGLVVDDRSVNIAEGVPSHWSEHSQTWETINPGYAYPIQNTSTGSNTDLWVAIQLPS